MQGVPVELDCFTYSDMLTLTDNILALNVVSYWQRGLWLQQNSSLTRQNWLDKLCDCHVIVSIHLIVPL